MIQSGDPQRYHEVNEAFHSTNLYRRPQHLPCRDHAIDTGACAAVSPRAISQPSARLAKSHITNTIAWCRQSAWRTIDCRVGDVYAYRYRTRRIRDLHGVPLNVRQAGICSARQERAPAATKLEIYARADGRSGLYQKTFHAAAIGQLDRCRSKGIGTAATSRPKVRRRQPQTSISIAAPSPPSSAAGQASAASYRSAQKPVSRAHFLATSSRRPPSVRTSPFSGRPDNERQQPPPQPRHRRATSKAAPAVPAMPQRAKWQCTIGMEHATDLGNPQINRLPGASNT